VEFNDTMTPPQVLSGPNPEYTSQALEHEVEGLMIVKCVVSVAGQVRDCRVIKSLPFMDKAVIDALYRRKYSPAQLHGQPIEVDYTFKIKLTLPQ
jgi:protein TonB